MERLDDRYTLDDGPLYLSGVHALVRLAIMQRRLDRARGLDTAGYVTGYRGSPLGTLDQAMARAKTHLDAHQIRVQPAINEELAATACLGSQQVGLFPGARHDGVFAMWYGKGPGVDRAGDALRHGNAAGTARYGGVLLLAGDDHACRSSTLPHQSEHAFVHLQIPVLAPADVYDVLRLGLAGWAISRFSGCWVALKLVAEVADSAATVVVDPSLGRFAVPAEDVAAPLGVRWPDPPLAQERRLMTAKLAAVEAFVRTAGLDRVVVGAGAGPRRLGIVTTGKAAGDVRQALARLGLSDAEAAALGLRVYQVAMPWPLEREGALAFAGGLDEVVVVEEKRPLIEPQLKDLLYHLPADRRPRVVGKTDEHGRPLLPAHGEVTPAGIARALAGRPGPLAAHPGVRAAADALAAAEAAAAAHPAPPIGRTAHFCPGCPHSRSTKVPDGSRALAGIGCHYMVIWMDRATATFTQMGGEGASWLGQAPFTDTPHVFANMGDGTYVHSGVLAIRAAVAAGVTMTIKILFNDAVAMTGGQPMDGGLTVARLTRQLAAEGVDAIVVVTDRRVGGHAARARYAPGTELVGRDRLAEVQERLTRRRGVSVLVFDQTCAAEVRRRRRRGLAPPPPRRLVIHEAVCEGCGDCSTRSNCLSVVPVDTEYGTKREIDQASCNADLACADGMCPSFVSVDGGRPRRASVAVERDPSPAPPDPQQATAPLAAPVNLLICGVGGTGVVTVANLIGLAAHFDGRGATVLDQTGLAQKGGAVTSHVRIAADPADLAAVRLGIGEADVVLGADPVVTAALEWRSRIASGRTRVILNARELPTAAFVRDPGARVPVDDLIAALRADAGAERVETIDAGGVAAHLAGDPIATNLVLLGAAWQRGLIPVSHRSLMRAIALNGVEISLNQQAFAWGRRLAATPEAVRVRLDAAVAAAADCDGATAADRRRSTSLEEAIARRAEQLTAYQGAKLAVRYRALVDRVDAAEAAALPGATALTAAVAESYHHVLAIKDEYEVARLFSRTGFLTSVRARFDGPVRLGVYLAPPLFARRDPVTGAPVKRRFGPWIFPLFTGLARLRSLRGTPFDPFGWTAERRADRAAIAAFERLVEALLAELTPTTHGAAVALAKLPREVRGFGPVRARARAAASARQETLWQAFRAAAASG